MQSELFDVDDNHGKNRLKTEDKDFMVKEIANEIFTKPSYREYLMNTSSTYHKTIEFIGTALTYFENEEAYEMCSYLVKFKEEIVKKVNEKLAF